MAALMPLTVDLRNTALALVDVLKQVVTLAGVALLVALGAHLTPFFAIQIAVGLTVIAVTPLVVGRGAIPRPRFDRAEQRSMLTTSLPLAAAIVLGHKDVENRTWATRHRGMDYRSGIGAPDAHLVLHGAQHCGAGEEDAKSNCASCTGEFRRPRAARGHQGT